MKCNNIITLENNEKYLTLNEVTYDKEHYFLVMGVDEEKNIIPGKVNIFKEINKDNEIYIEIIKDSDLIMELTKKLKEQIFNYADIYCFFDRMSLGNMLTVFTCLDKKQQDVIFEDLKRFNMNFNVQKIPDFINKIFCLVSIRNCVMHSNSLEILIRFYNPKTHELRKVSDRKKYLNMIKELCKEKTHDYS